LEERPQERQLQGVDSDDQGPFEGIVKWYDSTKAYGFIVQDDGNEIFFHRSGIAPGGPSEFADGSKVTYLVEPSPKGPQAVEVALMEE
jgi:CspA family cold shock protein